MTEELASTPAIFEATASVYGDSDNAHQQRCSPEKRIDDCSQPENSELSVVPVRPPRNVEVPSASGINWKFANQGTLPPFSLLEDNRYQPELGTNLIGIAADTSADEGTEDFERKAYLDGLTYLLRSLPSDLDAYERNQIRTALPVRLTLKDRSAAKSGASTPYSTTGTQKSIVHRLVQAVVLNLFLLLHFTLPYVVTVLKSAASVERKYKVSEAIVCHGMSCFNAAGRHCAKAAEVVWTASESQVGQGVSSSFAWAVEEVTRGISDGVGEGLVATRARDSERESSFPE